MLKLWTSGRVSRNARGLLGVCLASVGLLAAGWTDAAETQPATRPGGFQFDRTISREVLENYLSRAITVEGVFNGRGDLDDNIRMLKSIGVKYAGRSLCLWGAENNFLANVKRARQQVPKAIAADPEIVPEARKLKHILGNQPMVGVIVPPSVRFNCGQRMSFGSCPKNESRG